MTQAPDLSEFLSLSKPRAPQCAVGVAVATLTDQERALFASACETPQNQITNMALAKWLTAHAGDAWTGSWQTARSHRCRLCNCDQ